MNKERESRVCGHCRCWYGEENKKEYLPKDKGRCNCQIPEWLLEVDNNAIVISSLKYNCKLAVKCKCFILNDP